MRQLNDHELFNIDCSTLPWEPSTFAAGVSVKNVAVAGGLELQLVRFEPGARLPEHTHALPEFIYVLEGDLCIGDAVLGAGSASIASHGSVHANVHSVTGCTFVLVDQPL